MIYLVKIGENILSYEKISDKISLLDINPVMRDLGFPLANNSDIELLKGFGGSLVYKVSDSEFVWLINIEHIIGQEVELNNELVNKFNSTRESIKRDIKINKIIK